VRGSNGDGGIGLLELGVRVEADGFEFWMTADNGELNGPLFSAMFENRH
jgi:hypothetical protein